MLRNIFIATLLFFTSLTASAGTAFKVDEFRQNGDTICVYEYMGHRHYLNVGYKLCPLTYHVS